MGGVEMGALYKAGRGGVRVVWRDGTVSTYPAFSTVIFDHQPLTIEGRLLRVGPRNTLQHEAPALVPPEVKGS